MQTLNPQHPGLTPPPETPRLKSPQPSILSFAWRSLPRCRPARFRRRVLSVSDRGHCWDWAHGRVGILRDGIPLKSQSKAPVSCQFVGFCSSCMRFCKSRVRLSSLDRSEESVLTSGWRCWFVDLWETSRFELSLWSDLVGPRGLKEFVNPQNDSRMVVG